MHTFVPRQPPFEPFNSFPETARLLFRNLEIVGHAVEVGFEDPTAEDEPHSFEGRRRNDIRLRGPFRGSIDYDIKAYTLLAAHATSTTTRPPQDVPLPAHIAQQSLKYLNRVGRLATRLRPLTHGRFLPLVFSAGRLMAKDTAVEFELWKKEMGVTKLARLTTRLSIALLKARSRSFDVGRPGTQEDTSDEF